MKTGKKFKNLNNIISRLGSVVIAYSGGVDSTFLAKVCRDTLGKEKILAVSAISSTYPAFEFNEAKKTAVKLDIPWMHITSEELEIENFKKNSPDRCYYCKKELFKKLIKIAEQKRYKNVIDGTNFDDLNDFRPGMKALKEQTVISPLKLARINKKDIRRLSREMNIPTWNKPSYACLASRFPYGETITEKKLKRIDKAETILRKYKLKQIRVRSHNNTARIELEPQDFNKIIINRNTIIKKVKKLGFTYVTLDLEGYRTGSMNEVLK